MPSTQPRPCLILMANHPRSYREAIAAAVQGKRPDSTVIVIDPSDIDAALMRLAPNLVVCSHLTETIELHAAAWVVLYPDGANEALLCHTNRRATVREFNLDHLLSIIDGVHSSGPGRPHPI